MSTATPRCCAPVLDHPPKPPNAKAERHRERQRRHRQRQREHTAIALVAFDAAVLDGLIRSGWLDEHDAGNRQLVGAAISRLLRESFRDCS